MINQTKVRPVSYEPLRDTVTLLRRGSNQVVNRVSGSYICHQIDPPSAGIVTSATAGRGTNSTFQVDR